MYRKAFSLIELLVVMGVISVLISISVFGFTVMNRNGRNSKRVALINDIKLGFEQYYIRNGVHPDEDSALFNQANKQITICLDGGDGTICKSEKKIDLKVEGDHLVPAGDGVSTNRTTGYCYKVTSRGNYVLGVKLEGQDKWRDVGNDSTGCTGAGDPLLWGTT